MPTEFLVEDKCLYRATANAHIPDTPEARRLHQWVEEGSVLVPGNYEVIDQVEPQPVPGLRSDTEGHLKVDSTPMIRGTLCVAKVIFDATVYNPTLDENNLGKRFRGHAASRPKRYEVGLDQPAPTFEAFYSPELFAAIEASEQAGYQSWVYRLAPRSATNPSLGFIPVKGGFALYSPVATPTLDRLPVTSLLLGFGFGIDCTDPISDPQIAEYYRNNGIRSSELEFRG